jgi:5'-phosphate synthase pdxT subunit
MKIGVLALQGAVREHVQALERLGVKAEKVVLPEQLTNIQGLIIPGGESTTMTKLMNLYGFIEPIIARYKEGMGIFGTCAGMIVLAKEVVDGLATLGLMDISVKRNAYGRQVDSFEADLDVQGFNGVPFRGVFIRAPWIEKVSGKAELLASYENKGVLAQQGRLLAAAFHPELTADLRIHKLFIDSLKG